VDDTAVTGRYLPVPVSVRGPLAALELRVHALLTAGRLAEALAAADASEALAAAVGDEKTIGFLWQSRLHVHINAGRHEEAQAAGRTLLRRQQAAGNLIGEAKALAELALSLVLSGQITDGIGHLGRSGMLLDLAEPRGARYVAALASYSRTAAIVDLYEIAHTGYERIAALCPPSERPDAKNPYDLMHAEMLLRWGMRLDHLGQRAPARARLRRCAAITGRWLDSHPDHDTIRHYLTAYRALALAKLGHADEAINLAEASVMPLRTRQMYNEAILAHLALGIARSARGELTAADRELLAAQQLVSPNSEAADRLIVAQERTALAVRTVGAQASQTFLDAIDEQARQLWELRLQRLTMLRQAQEREALEAKHARAETALLHDPLTGLGNRLRFDRLISAIDDGLLPDPTALLLIDVDNFKTINDTYSHDAGDQVLRAIAGILRANCRSSQDVAVRYAGDEFTVFLHADLSDALEIAERICTAARTIDLNYRNVHIPVSVSTGVAVLAPGMTAKDLFRTADGNLYNAKRGGRDRVAA